MSEPVSGLLFIAFKRQSAGVTSSSARFSSCLSPAGKTRPLFPSSINSYVAHGPIGGNYDQPRSHGFLNYQCPRLHIARQHKSFRGMVCSDRLGAVDKPGPHHARSQTFGYALVQFVSQDPIADDQQIPIGPVVGNLGKGIYEQVYPLIWHQATKVKNVLALTI